MKYEIKIRENTAIITITLYSS